MEEQNQVSGEANRFPKWLSTVTPLSKILAMILFITLPFLGFYLGYKYAEKTIINQQTSNTKRAIATPINSTSSIYTIDVGVSYPISIPDKKILTTLYLPSGISVLQVDPAVFSQDALIAHYTLSYNDILARWEFDKNGTVLSPSRFGPNNEIEISALGDWMKTNDPSDVLYLDNERTQGMTIAQKAVFVSKLKSETASCISNASKGFTTDDKVYSICYYLHRPQEVGGNWVLGLRGYAEIDEKPVYLRGIIDLPNSYQSNLNSYIQALKKMTTTVIE